MVDSNSVNLGEGKTNCCSTVPSAIAITFEETVTGLMAGDFTRLGPMFLAAAGAGVGADVRCPIVRWFEEGRFEHEPLAFAEAFSCACFNGAVDVVGYFLARGVDPCGGAKTGLNAFHWAANRGQKDVVELLIRVRAPLEIRNAYGGTVLGGTVWAAVYESKPHHLAILRSLLDAGARVEEALFPSGCDQVDALLRRYQTGAGLMS